jgi:hypothetical protein
MVEPRGTVVGGIRGKTKKRGGWEPNLKELHSLPIVPTGSEPFRPSQGPVHLAERSSRRREQLGPNCATVSVRKSSASHRRPCLLCSTLSRLTCRGTGTIFHAGSLAGPTLRQHEAAFLPGRPGAAAASRVPRPGSADAAHSSAARTDRGKPAARRRSRPLPGSDAPR